MANKGNFSPGSGRGLSRSASKRKQNGTVLFCDTFAGGSRCGWRQHYSGDESAGVPWGPPSLTRYPALDDYALWLTGTARPNAEIPTDVRGGGFSAYRNLSRFFDKDEVGLISFSGYFAEYFFGGAAGTMNWTVGIDSQLWDSSDRSFFQVNCRRPGTGKPYWYITLNDGSVLQIPASVGHTAGPNQGKFNWNYVELVVDLSKNSGRGGYHSLQVNDVSYDLTDASIYVVPASYTSVQSGQQSPQGGNPATPNTADHYADFRGGLNFGIFGLPNDASYTGAGLACARLTATIYDAD